MGQQDNIHIGDKFGRLVVTSLPYRKENKRWYVDCECTCEKHTKKSVRVEALIKGHTKGCGCVARDNAKLQGKKFKKYNKYDLTGEFGIGYTSNQNKRGENFFYFDLEDYDKIKDHCWCFDKDGYLMSIDTTTRQNIKMHRIIMDAPKGMEVDHINHNSDGSDTNNDNRKENLRICTHKQNTSNRIPINPITKEKEIDRIPGVIKVKGKWRASLGTKTIGWYATKEEAEEARLKAEKEQWQEYSFRENIKDEG